MFAVWKLSNYCALSRTMFGEHLSEYLRDCLFDYLYGCLSDCPSVVSLAVCPAVQTGSECWRFARLFTTSKLNWAILNNKPFQTVSNGFKRWTKWFSQMFSTGYSGIGQIKRIRCRSAEELAINLDPTNCRLHSWMGLSEWRKIWQPNSCRLRCFPPLVRLSWSEFVCKSSLEFISLEPADLPWRRTRVAQQRSPVRSSADDDAHNPILTRMMVSEKALLDLVNYL